MENINENRAIAEIIKNNEEIIQNYVKDFSSEILKNKLPILARFE